jgi:hypothetical protein
MGKSYRKPWGSVCHIKGSAHHDKKFAARAVRRSQNQALREAIDWDEFLIPERYECSDNDVWGWSRDGKQRPLNFRYGYKQYNNPYAYLKSPVFWTDDEIIKRWHEDMQDDDELIAYASRK